MELLITFAIGMMVGIALGVAVTIVVAWTKEKIECQRTFDVLPQSCARPQKTCGTCSRVTWAIVARLSE